MPISPKQSHAFIFADKNLIWIGDVSDMCYMLQVKNYISPIIFKMLT